jgi:hypothetical protein
MKLTKEQLKSIIKEELGKIMDEKIELGNYKDRVDKAAAEKELKKKQSICAQLDQKIYDYFHPEDAQGQLIFKYSKKEYEQFMKARKEAGCEELDNEEQKQFEKDEAEKERKRKMRDYHQGITDTMKVARTYQTREDIQKMVQEELGKIMDEKIELGNYKDRMAQKAKAEAEAKKKARCRSLASKITDAENSRDMSSMAYGGPENEASQEDIDRMNREHEALGCSDLMRQKEDIQKMVEEELAAVTKGN